MALTKEQRAAMVVQTQVPNREGVLGVWLSDSTWKRYATLEAAARELVKAATIIAACLGAMFIDLSEGPSMVESQGREALDEALAHPALVALREK